MIRLFVVPHYYRISSPVGVAHQVSALWLEIVRQTPKMRLLMFLPLVSFRLLARLIVTTRVLPSDRTALAFSSYYAHTCKYLAIVLRIVIQPPFYRALLRHL